MDIFLRSFVGGGDGAGIDPSRDESHLRGTQRRFLVGHPREVLVRSGDDLNEQALCAPAGLEGRAMLAALERGGCGVQPHPAFLLGCAVAAVAVLGEEWLDVTDVIGRRAVPERDEGEENGEIEQGQLHVRCSG